MCVVGKADNNFVGLLCLAASRLFLLSHLPTYVCSWHERAGRPSICDNLFVLFFLASGRAGVLAACCFFLVVVSSLSLVRRKRRGIWIRFCMRALPV